MRVFFSRRQRKRPYGTLCHIESFRSRLFGKGGHVICLSGGNGGISSAMVCARLGLSCTVVASDNISLYDMRHIRAFGADILMTAAKLGLEGVRRKALEVQKQRGGFIYDQFSDPLCPEAHRKTTAPEIISALPVIDCFISGIGTGATVTGCGEYIKMMCPRLHNSRRRTL